MGKKKDRPEQEITKYSRCDFRIDDKEKAMLDYLSAVEGKSKSNIIRDLVRSRFDEITGGLNGKTEER